MKKRGWTVQMSQSLSSPSAVITSQSPSVRRRAQKPLSVNLKCQPSGPFSISVSYTHLKAHAKLTDVVETYRAYQKLQKTYDDDQALLEMGESDEELAAMAEMEMKELAPQLEEDVYKRQDSSRGGRCR